MVNNGFLLINKSVGWTSRDVCNKVSKIFNVKKVGHIGTLDPFATGLLIVAVGEATKCLPYISDNKKSYIAKLKLGEKTSSGDVTSDIIEIKDVPMLNEKEINDVLVSFLGKNTQKPPMTSAVHYNGQKLYKLYQQGIKIDVPERKIEIFNIKLLSFIDNCIEFSTTVSKGTYIRTLGEDIAKKLNTVGHLISLERTAIESINNYDGINVDSVNYESLIKINDFMCKFIAVKKVDKSVENLVRNGAEISLDANSNKILLINEDDSPLAFYGKIENNLYKCLRGLNCENN